ncbi:MAG TPA: hypothetical protein PLA88_10860, partial [Bacteroidales bacterium]|nr:hypothetical protein [Bacteroidales bacterium]
DPGTVSNAKTQLRPGTQKGLLLIFGILSPCVISSFAPVMHDEDRACEVSKDAAEPAVVLRYI